MPIPELMEQMLAAEGEEMCEEVKKAITDMKDGVETVAPVTEEQVTDLKKLLAGGISRLFKKSNEVPNFAQIFLGAEEDDTNELIEIYKDPCNDDNKLGHSKETT